LRFVFFKKNIMSRLLISGSTGFIGKPMMDHFLAKGHTVVKLVRSETLKGSDEETIFWNPEEGKAVKEPFEGFDAVIHLAGEPIMGRWTKRKKRKILFSRTSATWFLTQILSQLLQPPQFFLSASAIGYYGDRGDELLTEESEAGRGFLANVCCEWEKASRAIESRGVRSVQARFGTVLGPGGGVLQKLAPLYKFGLGGKFGSGKQWISWVHREDLIRAIDHCMSTPEIEGAVNVVSPYPVRQEEFSHSLAEILDRPARLNLPAWILRLILGEAADEVLLASSRVEPRKLMNSHFSFRYLHLIDALHKAFK
jgi:uncharacterized protein